MDFVRLLHAVFRRGHAVIDDTHAIVEQRREDETSPHVENLHHLRRRLFETPGGIGSGGKLFIFRLQGAIKSDHARHELRREGSDAAIVQKIDAAVIAHRVIAQMRIAVDRAVTREGPPPCLEQRGGNGVARLQPGFFEFRNRRAIEPCHRQKALGGERCDGFGHGNVVAILQHDRIELHVRGLAHIIQFFGKAFGDFLAEFRRVDGVVETALEHQRRFQLAHIGIHRRIHRGILQLAGKARSVFRNRAVHLAQRCGGCGFLVEGLELSFPTFAEFRFHAPAHETCAHWRRTCLQSEQRCCNFRRQDAGNRRNKLRNLHHRTAQISQNAREIRRVLRGHRFGSTERSRGATRSNTRQAAGNARKTRNPFGYAVFAFVHEILPRSLRANRSFSMFAAFAARSSPQMLLSSIRKVSQSETLKRILPLGGDYPCAKGPESTWRRQFSLLTTIPCSADCSKPRSRARA